MDLADRMGELVKDENKPIRRQQGLAPVLPSATEVFGHFPLSLRVGADGLLFLGLGVFGVFPVYQVLDLLGDPARYFSQAASGEPRNISAASRGRPSSNRKFTTQALLEGCAAHLAPWYSHINMLTSRSSKYPTA